MLGLLASVAASHLFGVGVAWFFVVHVGVWLCCDLLLLTIVEVMCDKMCAGKIEGCGEKEVGLGAVMMWVGRGEVSREEEGGGVQCESCISPLGIVHTTCFE